MLRRDFLGFLGAATASVPLALRAEPALPVVGLVSAASRANAQLPQLFPRFMKEFGWEEDRNYRAIYLWSEGHDERVPGLVRDLVAQRVDVIVVLTELAIEAARHATQTIPIVCISFDLVRAGLAASLARPGSNITGVNLRTSELNVKRLELVHQALPAARRIGVLADPHVDTAMPELQEASRQLGLELVIALARNVGELDPALDELDRARVDAVNVLASPLFASESGRVAERLNRMRVAAIYPFPEDVIRWGALFAYGPRLALMFRHVAGLVAKILAGARPEDLPVENADKFDLVVNLKVAKALGLDIPPTFLARADEVIE
ncbi:MAG TPA: ABC transporter substrate-binding protein [Stellaceae bacterium]|nr:ABC transporter substrate-binding protein [Stellaceae bacterium]